VTYDTEKFFPLWEKTSWFLPHAWNVVTAVTSAVTPAAPSFVTAARFVVTTVIAHASPEPLRFGTVVPLSGTTPSSSGGTFPDFVVPMMICSAFSERCYGRNIGCYAIIFPACHKFGYRRNSDDVPRFARDAALWHGRATERHDTSSFRWYIPAVVVPMWNGADLQ